MRKVSVFLLKFYKTFVSPLLVKVFGGACRYTPTCSEYAIDAIRKYGFLKGFVMATKRIGRCHPWGGHGFDPVV